MRFIRTKDGRILDLYGYELVEETDNVRYYRYYNFANRDFDNVVVMKRDILKESDNIEDLCDCFSYETETTTDFGVALGWKFQDQKRDIYGCIKTNKGLIYIGEMTKEGNMTGV